MKLLKIAVNKLLGFVGFKLVQKKKDNLPIELDSRDRENISKAKKISMTTEERLASLILSVKYLNANKIAGDFVECGVWAGGSIALAILSDKETSLNRKYWLYDTFDGMTRPSPEEPEWAHTKFDKEKNQQGGSSWCSTDLDTVKGNLRNLGINLTQCNFVKGDVESTLKKELPEKIALLRLDTDWYESTKLELENLYPRLQTGGILIIDDYGYWSGARKAVDEFFSNFSQKPFMHPIDHTGRLVIKL